MVTPQLWPHSFLSLAYVSKDRNYDELTLAEFTAGYASILQLNSLFSDERAGRLNHFAWLAVREFHSAVLFEIECGRARWDDSVAHLDSRLLRTPTKPMGNSSSNTVLFCRDFQSGTCAHTKNHYGMIRYGRKWLQHICTKCC